MDSSRWSWAIYHEFDRDKTDQEPHRRTLRLPGRFLNLAGTDRWVFAVDIEGIFIDIRRRARRLRRTQRIAWASREILRRCRTLNEVFQLLCALREKDALANLLLEGFYQLLLAPILDRPDIARRIESMGSRPTIVIAAHGALAHIPFAALRDGRGYLAERFNVVQAARLYVGDPFETADIDWEAMLGGEPLPRPMAFRILANTADPSLRQVAREVRFFEDLRAARHLDMTDPSSGRPTLCVSSGRDAASLCSGDQIFSVTEDRREAGVATRAQIGSAAYCPRAHAICEDIVNTCWIGDVG